MPADTLRTVRRWILFVLVLGLTGSGVELLLIEHYEFATQLVPLVLVAASLGVIVWHVASESRASVRGLQLMMLLCLAGGAVGVALHFQGAAEFQLEMGSVYQPVDARPKGNAGQSSSCLAQASWCSWDCSVWRMLTDGVDNMNSSMES
jgi:hypothetical protein